MELFLIWLVSALLFILLDEISRMFSQIERGLFEESYGLKEKKNM